MRRTEIYTDGGASPNPGPGGWGVVILGARGVVEELSGGELDTTNNRMEMTAAIRALEAVGEGAEVALYSDSRYLRQGITRWVAGWMRRNWNRVDSSGNLHPVKNVDLWKRLVELESKHRVTWHWLKGHAGHQHNERADALATTEIERLQASLPTEETVKTEETPAVTTDAEALIRITCQRDIGAWAILLMSDQRQDTITGSASPVTANRAELLAGLELFEQLPTETSVTIRAGDYLRKGAAEWLAGWKMRAWRTGAGQPVKNGELWRKIDHAMTRLKIVWLPLEKDDPLAQELGKRAKAELAEAKAARGR